jgi:hypothetical protein
MSLWLIFCHNGELREKGEPENVPAVPASFLTRNGNNPHPSKQYVLFLNLYPSRPIEMDFESQTAS